MGNDRKWQRKESKTSRKDPTVTSAGWVWQVVAASMVANDEGDIRIPEDRRYLLLIAPLLLPVRENLKAARGFSRRCGPPWTLLDRHIMKEAKPKQGSKFETGTCQVRGGCFRPKKEKTTIKALQGYYEYQRQSMPACPCLRCSKYSKQSMYRRYVFPQRSAFRVSEGSTA